MMSSVDSIASAKIAFELVSRQARRMPPKTAIPTPSESLPALRRSRLDARASRAAADAATENMELRTTTPSLATSRDRDR